MSTILIVDDDEEIRYSLGRVLGSRGYHIETAGSGEEGIEKIKAGLKPDLIMCDVRMGGISGIETLQHMRSASSSLQIVLMTAFGTAQTAIEAMKFGAYDYIMKPFDVDKVIEIAEKAISSSQDMKSANKYEKKVNYDDYKEGIVGNSPAMQEVFKVIGQVAASDATVLVTGESGTGKELIAKCIVQHSLRSGGPFVAVNCAAIPDNLIESELFGHEKGSFTGATTQRIGRFEQCDRGTIFLDEIGDMALATQTKILRVLQEGEIQRVGSTETIKVDVRVIAATNKDLEKMVEEKEFREDLYYRLNVFRIRVPALKERKEDIPDIVDFMLQNLVKERKARVTRVSPDALKAIVSYAWPGNVRELGNVVYRSAVVAQGDAILLKDLPDTIRGASGESAAAVAPAAPVPPAEPVAAPLAAEKPAGISESAAVESTAAAAEPVPMPAPVLPVAEVMPISLPAIYDKLYHELRERQEMRILTLIERQMIERAISETGGNQARAAEILGITRNTLKKRLDEYASE
ncbi:sigma-54 dependent transcriptional regulator [Pelagicoccus sp. SDUM812005]|uniref:sigma-54-dependent transcriptional regulator n=1 Tax=Pelagicoccus sp. SDUM812005 TaxID=3041257 RepID=UPI00280DD806|nr:sigma-54 dependent transcriptional regulator [Pelagicoccus sp. SDUM812005]MDQ8179022.1 sigma-54 dependent transcriptional regulator [Pelagicoccus sp. SDUM812005]